jgi:hypothetical protein
MSENPSSAPSVDITPIEEIAEGDYAFIIDTLHTFREQLDEVEEAYRQALEHSAYEQLRAVHHKVKPSLSLIRIPELSRLFEETREALLHEGTLTREEMQRMTHAMHDILMAVRSEIDRLARKYQS